MNIKTSTFIPQQTLNEISPLVLSLGTSVLQKSEKLEKYNLSLREVFGLCVLSIFRSVLEPNEKWVFTTEPQISDDGAVAIVGSNNKITYYESVEQVYLPGHFLERNDNQSMNDYILEHIDRTKNKGLEYQKDKTLLILSDIKSHNSDDFFEWQDFVKKFFAKNTFLHLYFLTLIGHVSGSNEYYFLSFTNQKHRQKLNGEFRFKVKDDGLSDFKCIQKIDLLKKK
ncbi:MAG: hypothetical protein HGA67_02095 [Candidatus Yonathbacteria bacterium]|nr:hypothetical protein [Candidatus Yonathbacteria bacterium]